MSTITNMGFLVRTRIVSHIQVIRFGTLKHDNDIWICLFWIWYQPHFQLRKRQQKVWDQLKNLLKISIDIMWGCQDWVLKKYQFKDKQQVKLACEIGQRKWLHVFSIKLLPVNTVYWEKMIALCFYFHFTLRLNSGTWLDVVLTKLCQHPVFTMLLL